VEKEEEGQREVVRVFLLLLRALLPHRLRQQQRRHQWVLAERRKTALLVERYERKREGEGKH
jgi:hypothetical protein